MWNNHLRIYQLGDIVYNMKNKKGYLVKRVKITPIFANITHQLKIKTKLLIETKMPFFFSPTLTTSSILLHLQNDSSYFPKSSSHHFLLLHYLPLVHKTESSSPLQLHLQNESSFSSSSSISLSSFDVQNEKSHISFKNPIKFLVYPLILCFILNPWKNCYSIFSSYLILYLQARRKQWVHWRVIREKD